MARAVNQVSYEQTDRTAVRHEIYLKHNPPSAAFVNNWLNDQAFKAVLANTSTMYLTVQQFYLIVEG